MSTDNWAGSSKETAWSDWEWNVQYNCNYRYRRNALGGQLSRILTKETAADSEQESGSMTTTNKATKASLRTFLPPEALKV
jgi:hypothetical protein